MILATSFTMTAVAQHYVKIVNNTLSINCRNYGSGDILQIEVDSAKVCYIHITKQSSNENTRRNGVVEGAKFLITEFNNDPLKVKFNDEKGDPRNNCYIKGEILVKIDDDYLKFNDVTFLSSADVNNCRNILLQEIKSVCSYDSKKKILDFTQCPYSYILNNNTYKGDTQYNIEPNTQIKFLTTAKNVPNIILSTQDFIKSATDDKAPKESWLIGLKKHWIELVGGILGIILIIILLLWLRNKKRLNGNEEDSDDNDDDVSEPMKKQKHIMKEAKKNKKRRMPNQNPVVYEQLFKKLTDFLTHIESTQDALSKQTNTLEDIRLLVSNTEEKKQLTQKIKELEAEKDKSAIAITQRDEALSEVTKLKTQIAQLQAGAQIDGAVQFVEYSTFVSYAKKIISECNEAENVAIKYWGALNNKDQQILNGFLSKFQMTKCNIDLAKWNGIIATLDLEGYIKNDEYITYLTPLSNKERLVFLFKRFFEEILRPYVGTTILFLEQIRTATKIGVSTTCNENIDGYINSICTKCFEQGVLIDYRKLYEKVTEYDSLEIVENIPDYMKKIIANIENEDILLYVDKYAVNLKSGEMIEKTRCYIKI